MMNVGFTAKIRYSFGLISGWYVAFKTDIKEVAEYFGWAIQGAIVHMGKQRSFLGQMAGYVYVAQGSRKGMRKWHCDSFQGTGLDTRDLFLE